jgi:hypothetical protein
MKSKVFERSGSKPCWYLGCPVAESEADVRPWNEFLVDTNLGRPVLFDASFKAARDKRQAYFDYRLGKIYNTPCF